MPILIDSSSRLLFQGVHSEQDIYQLQQCIAYGSKFVGGIAPGKRGQELLGIPLFETVQEAKKKTGCTVSVLFTQKADIKEALLESLYSSLSCIVCLCEKVPLHDMVDVYSLSSCSRIVGPSSSGIITPGQCKAGRMPGYLFKEGCVGILSSSETFLYEAAIQTTKEELGQSTCLVQGVYPLPGLSLVAIADLFYKDVATKVILLLGSMTDRQVQQLIDWKEGKNLKPIVAYVTGSEESVLHQRRSLTQAGIFVTENISLLGTLSKKVLSL